MTAVQHYAISLLRIETHFIATCYLTHFEWEYNNEMIKADSISFLDP
jgi:hypothetical protein